MPLWAKIYVIVFLLFTMSNLGYNLYLKSRLLIVFYDFFSGLFFILAMISFWRPVLRDYFGFGGALIFFLLLFFEFYLSALGGYKKLGLKLPEEMKKEDLETALAFSVVFSAPAYICGGLAMLENIAKIF